MPEFGFGLSCCQQSRGTSWCFSSHPGPPLPVCHDWEVVWFYQPGEKVERKTPFSTVFHPNLNQPGPEKNHVELGRLVFQSLWTLVNLVC